MRCASAACLALILTLSPAGALELKPLQSVEWSEDDGDFGGFSGLVVADGGKTLWAVSDAGTLWRADVQRGADGRIAAIKAKWHDRMLDNKGEPVSGFTEDAEALAPRPDGGVFIAYESYARVTGLHPPDMKPEALNDFDRFKPYWDNASFEGLARLPDGRLLVVVETHDGAAGGYPTFIGDDGKWQTGPTLRTAPDFGASDATVDDEGRLWLLERRLTWMAEFEVRISTCPVVLKGPSDCTPVMSAPAGTLGNMEGMSIWHDPDGREILTLISDDNFNPLSSTAVAEYEILP